MPGAFRTFCLYDSGRAGVLTTPAFHVSIVRSDGTLEVPMMRERSDMPTLRVDVAPSLHHVRHS